MYVYVCVCCVCLYPPIAAAFVVHFDEENIEGDRQFRSTYGGGGDDSVSLRLRGNISRLDKWLSPPSNSDKHRRLSGTELVGGIEVQRKRWATVSERKATVSQAAT